MRHIGFLGLGIMGEAMAHNLVRAGFEVTVWNRTPSKCAPLVEAGATAADSAAAVVAASDVTFGIVSDPAAAEAVCFGPDGVLAGLRDGRGYVDMSTVDPATSRRIGAAVRERGGRFLEAPVAGSRKPAEDGTLVILAAGDRDLFERVEPAFDVLGRQTFFLGETGRGAAAKLFVNMVMGELMVALCEGLSLGREAGLGDDDLLAILDASAYGNPMFRLKGRNIVEGRHDVQFPLEHMQKDMRLALALGDALAVSLPGAAAANQAFVQARRRGHGRDDFAAVSEVVGGGRGAGKG